MDSRFEESRLVLQLFYYIHFRKGMNFIFQAIGEIQSLLFFYKDRFGIK